MEVFVNRTSEGVGIRDAVQRADWIAVTLAGVGLDTYGLDTDISTGVDTSPYFDPGSLGPLFIPLTTGDLIFSDVSTLAYTSSVAVPLPAAAWLFGGALGILVRTRRRPR